MLKLKTGSIIVFDSQPCRVEKILKSGIVLSNGKFLTLNEAELLEIVDVT